MKWIAVSVIGASLMVYGQATKPHADTHTTNAAAKQADATDTAGQTIIVVNQQAPQRQENDHPSRPPSYLDELLAPANLPNLLLVVVGMVGIVIAICTLLAIRNQAIEMRRQRIEMRGQRNVMGHQLKAMREQTTHMESQLTEMQESRKIENKTLLLQYRPKIVVRNARASRFSFEFGEPGECELEFTMVNTGGTPAHIMVGGSIKLISCIARAMSKTEFKEGDGCQIAPVTLQPGQQVIVQEY